MPEPCNFLGRHEGGFGKVEYKACLGDEVLGICHKEGEEVGVVVCEEEVIKVLPVEGGNVEERLEIVRNGGLC